MRLTLLTTIVFAGVCGCFGAAGYAHAEETDAVSRVLVLTPPNLASPGHCIGDVSSVRCAVETMHACTKFDLRAACDRLGIPDYPAPWFTREQLVTVYVLRSVALLDEAAAREIRWPKAVAPGWAFVSVEFARCVGVAPHLTCGRHETGVVDMLFRPSPRGWQFEAYEDEFPDEGCDTDSFECRHTIVKDIGPGLRALWGQSMGPPLRSIAVDTRDLVPAE